MRILAAALPAVCVASLCACSSPQATAVSRAGIEFGSQICPPNLATNEEAIRAVTEANVKATNERNSAGVVATYFPEAELIITGYTEEGGYFEDRFSGIEEIQANEENFYRIPGWLTWTVTVDEVRFLKPDVAISEGTSTTDWGERQSHGTTTRVLACDESGWRMANVVARTGASDADPD